MKIYPPKISAGVFLLGNTVGFLWLLYFPALMKESSGGISAAFVSTDFKALYGYIFL
jgi:hypothetical protein